MCVYTACEALFIYFVVCDLNDFAERIIGKDNFAQQQRHVADGDTNISERLKYTWTIYPRLNCLNLEQEC